MTKFSSKKSAASTRGVQIPASIIDAWRKMIIETAKFPKGTEKKSLSDEELLRIAAKSEREAVVELWTNFTSERENLTQNMLTSKKEVVAYLLGFHIANTARLLHVLGEAKNRSKLINGMTGYKEISVVDLGCGSGAMTQATMAFIKDLGFHKKLKHVLLMDVSQPLLDIAGDGVNYLNPKIKISQVKGSIETLGDDKISSNPEKLTILNMGYIWNELAKNVESQKHLGKILQKTVSDNQSVMINFLEPATQDQSREAMVFHDELVGFGYVPLYPCAHANPCPMLERTRDWCYSELHWRRPPDQTFIDSLTHIDRRLLRVSGYVFASPAFMKNFGREKDFKDRVIVGRPTHKDTAKEERKFDYLLCSEDGITKMPAEEGRRTLIRGQIIRG